jgi:hypothetical protein
VLVVVLVGGWVCLCACACGARLTYTGSVVVMASANSSGSTPPLDVSLDDPRFARPEDMRALPLTEPCDDLRIVLGLLLVVVSDLALTESRCSATT